MNAQNIWAGNDYAFRGGSGRGERFSLACERVRVRRVVKETLAGNMKASTFVIVQFINRDTGEVLDGPKRWTEVNRTDDDKLYKVRAFDFIENWDNVEDEYQHLNAKYKREEAEREAREREANERREREAQERQLRLDRVRDYLVSLGIHSDWIKSITPTNTYYNHGIELDFAKVEEAVLNLNTNVVELPNAS